MKKSEKPRQSSNNIESKDKQKPKLTIAEENEKKRKFALRHLRAEYINELIFLNSKAYREYLNKLYEEHNYEQSFASEVVEERISTEKQEAKEYFEKTKKELTNEKGLFTSAAFKAFSTKIAKRSGAIVKKAQRVSQKEDEKRIAVLNLELEKSTDSTGTELTKTKNEYYSVGNLRNKIQLTGSDVHAEISRNNENASILEVTEYRKDGQTNQFIAVWNPEGDKGKGRYEKKKKGGPKLWLKHGYKYEFKPGTESL